MIAHENSLFMFDLDCLLTKGRLQDPTARLTGGSVWFLPVSFVLNNDNLSEADGTKGQPADGFLCRS